MVRAVLTERQTRDCDIKCHITFSFQWKFYVYGPQYRLENEYDDFVKEMPRQYGVFLSIQFLYFFSKISQTRDFGASKHYGSLEKIIKHLQCNNLTYERSVLNRKWLSHAYMYVSQKGNLKETMKYVENMLLIGTDSRINLMKNQGSIPISINLFNASLNFIRYKI